MALVLLAQVDDLRNVRTRRGWLFVIYSVFFFVEGVFIMLFPAATLKACPLAEAFSPQRKTSTVASIKAFCSPAHSLTSCVAMVTAMLSNPLY